MFVYLNIMEQTKNVVGWFEIPVLDMGRAVKFYQSVFGYEMTRGKLGPLEMAFFPGVAEGTGAFGALVYNETHYQPSADGVLLYFTTPSGEMEAELERVEPAGGKLLRPKTMISEEVGYMGLFIDTEGNRIAIHSRN